MTSSVASTRLRGTDDVGWRLLAALLVTALLAGCASSGSTSGPSTAEPKPVAAGRCDGVTRSEVKGREPGYGPHTMRSYPVAAAVCAAYWVDGLDDWFIPQSIELIGSRVLVAGYQRKSPRLGNHPCQLLELDPKTGRTVGFLARWEAPVYSSEPTFCRHSGGMEADDSGLWLVESNRLWLLDPDHLFDGDPVRRVWTLPPNVKGSALVIDGSRMGIGRFRIDRSARMAWFSIPEILATSGELPDPLRWRPVPRRLQGIATGPGGIWFTSTGTHCAELHTSEGRRLSFVPGAEDVEFVGRSIWTVSEAGARYFLDPDEETIPAVLRLDRDAVLAGAEQHCPW
ncbi:hypothetical protein ACLM5J_05745 [Nocardioides sp. Bht2]|uniref:hypothetical protein n=1 Tax=Nocardioides sp. Bht2 TaxID=3392297 RepID=UPI0039B4F12F